jgi:hypothetical protein
MAAQARDEWEKPRSKGQHLTEQEIALLKTSYKAGHSPREAARAIKCSSRIANKYYSYFRAEGVRRTIDNPLPTAPASRFYKSSFEL